MTTIKIQTRHSLNTLMQQRDTGPFVSLYVNTVPGLQAANRQRLQFKQLISTAEQLWGRHFPQTDFTPYREQLTALRRSPDFWKEHVQAQAGIIVNAEQCFTFDLQYPTTEQVIVNRMPAIRPLLADRQHQFDFDLLALSEDRIQLYQQRHGQFAITELPADAPVTLRGTLGTEKRGGDLNFNSSPVHGVNYHGHNAKAEERAVDQRNYYLQVAKFMDNWSKRTQRPLILMGLPHNQALFRQLTQNPHLSAVLKIDQSPNNLSPAAVLTATTPVQSQWHTHMADILLARYDQAIGQKRALADPFDMIKPALNGRVSTLIVAADAQVDGTIPATDVMLTEPLALPDNLIDDLVDVVMAANGQVRIIPAERMPANTSALAILRY
ncbi:baeRF6 domain-containing protein [Lactiplantibacillus modestisalitolerans]|uniref:Bacterial archaeo-eukaryotic release factor family 6 domain-containing protein n=1 Tax=Lactiplantibacillus modestisalitolerans TaxID=1457219 RepID=A0ABV5WWZ8_9LACO|nr:hypothetical protein [Lactiplantibacillus modestisalitolerans]